MNEALLFEDITFGYPGGTQEPVFSALSLAIPRGRITALLGPNGVGKTTLLGLALGWLQPGRGTVSLFGEPISTLSRGEMGRAVALVPQSEYIPFEFTVTEYTLLGRSPHLRPLELPKGLDLAVAESALTEAGILHLRDRPVTELSAGERQLLLLARALAQEPRLLLLDEPSSHLDLANKQKLLSVLRNRVEGGMTAVFTSHDPSFAAAIASEVCLLERGQVFAVGDPLSTLTPENLSRTYGVPVDVRLLDGEPVVVWHRQSR
jgi:iron complex transport system ATP-binding protein